MIKTLPYKELIEKLKSKGVTFEIMNEDSAEHFLKEHNYYVKVASYRFNYNKYEKKYVNLDFFHLKELSIIDMHLKFTILKACLNIEHSLKVNILNDILEKEIDDFKIVSQYVSKYSKCIENIESHRNTSYAKELLDKYPHPKYPIWVFLEVISFGELVNFYRFYKDTYESSLINPKLLYNVRDIRNAAAHSNCLIHNLGSQTNKHISQELRNFLIIESGYGKNSINKKLNNKTIHDFIAMLYVFDKVVKSHEIKSHRYEDLLCIFDKRMLRNRDMFLKNNIITSSYSFAKKTLDIFSYKV